MAVEHEAGTKYQATNMESHVLNGANGNILQNNVTLGTLFRYDKHGTADSDKDKSQGSKDINPKSSGFNNPMRISRTSHSNFHRQRKSSTKYPGANHQRTAHKVQGHSWNPIHGH